MVFVESVTLLRAKKARGCRRAFRAPAPRQFPEDPRLPISEDRSKKRPLTHRRQLFAVRHRLRHDSPARAFAPFVVELFAVGLISPERRACSSARSPSLRTRELPTPANVVRTLRDFHPSCSDELWSEPRWRILTALSHRGLDYRQGLSRSPPFRGSFDHGIETSRLSSFRRRSLVPRFFSIEDLPIRTRRRSRKRVTSTSLPRARTSHSRGIRLYGSTALRVVKPAPFRELVRFASRAPTPIVTASRHVVTKTPRA